MENTHNIPPLKIVLNGEFWDSHIYKGKLYLFTIDGDVHTVDWDRLVAEYPLPDDLVLPMECAFARSNYLYGDQWNLLYQDPEVRTVVQRKFMRLSTESQNPLVADWKKFLLGTHASPFPFPHSDTTIYMNNLYSVSKSGLFTFPSRKLHAKRPKKYQAERIWDCPVISVDASYFTLALAAGEEGLFEFDLTDPTSGVPERDKKPIDSRHFSDCSWAYYSIMGSSHEVGGILLEYVKSEDQGHAELFVPDNVGPFSKSAPQLHRRFDKAVQVSDVFHKSGYSWGGKDKICSARDGVMTVARYVPWFDDPDRLRILREIHLDPWKGNPVSGEVAPFGSIIELDNCIVVVRSDDEVFTIRGTPVNWRVFNRSKQYENQLHVIYDDRLEIFSFNHDYFLDQDEKVSGAHSSSSMSYWKRGRRKI